MFLYKQKYVNLIWLVFSLLGGVLLGVLWWLVAPGGVWGLSVEVYEYNAGRDGVFVLLNFLAGLCGFVFLLLRKSSDEFVKIFVAVVSGVLGSLTMWLVGTVLGSFFVSLSTAPDLFKEFVLFSRGAVVLWPLITVFLYFILTLFKFLIGSAEKEDA